MKSKIPFLSIITVVYNGEHFLEKTIKSIITQKCKNLEYIIIDGGSTDGTLDIIDKYEDSINYWISEKDEGIYDAMNKGIEKSTGEGLLFLNAGDYFVGDVITKKISIPSFLPVKYINRLNKLTNVKIKNHKYGIPNCHQGIIFENKDIKYNLKYKVVADYEYFLRHGYENLSTSKSIGYVYYDNEGFSKVNYKKRDDELYEIIYNHFGLLYASNFKIKSFLKSIIKSIIK